MTTTAHLELADLCLEYLYFLIVCLLGDLRSIERLRSGGGTDLLHLPGLLGQAGADAAGTAHAGVPYSTLVPLQLTLPLLGAL